MTNVLLYLQYVHFSVNLRWRSDNTRCWYDASLQQIHEYKVLVQRRPTVYAPTCFLAWQTPTIYAPTQCSGMTQTYSIWTKAMFWYDTGLQYMHQHNVLVRHKPTLYGLMQCSGTTQAYSICTNTIIWYDMILQYMHQHNVLVRHKSTLYGLMQCSGTTQA